MAIERGAIHIGTSGWHYKHWKGPFYPPEMRSGEYLAYYAERFQTVEINNSFYRLPEVETFVQWRETVPSGFLFAVKANRYITHMKKLKDPEQPVDNLLSATTALGDKLGPILFQLPPRWRFNAERLNQFLAVLPAGYRYAFEFRDPSWYDERAYEALAQHNAAFCIYRMGEHTSPLQVTADFVYVRLHGPESAYYGAYSDEELAFWAMRMNEWRQKGCDVYCYFDNDPEGHAPRDATRLREIVASGQ